jgi:YegS/Rv2252/BmrU family lipid kinase
MKATLDVERKKRTLYGALAGGLAGLLVGPVGVIVGAAAAAAAGHASVKEPQQHFTQSFLQGVLDAMRPGSSAVVGLIESTSLDGAMEDLGQIGGRLIRQPLPAEAVLELSEDSDQAEEGLAQTFTQEQLVSRIDDLVGQGTRPGLSFKRVHVVINPASGQDEPILNRLNAVFHTSGIDWDISLTKRDGDATRMARAAAENGADVVASYGGDGTVMEVAAGLTGSGVPLAIFPGGTANVVSLEMGIPRDLIEAAVLIAGAPSKLRPLDLGTVNDQMFALRIGVGYEAEVNRGATRELKDRLGIYAYTLANLKTMAKPPSAMYKLDLDGEIVEMEALWCMIANSANLGMPGFSLVQDTDMGDGLLDVIMVRPADLHTAISVAGSVAHSDRVGQPLPQWKVRRVKVSSDPPQYVTVDGENWEAIPIAVKVIPNAVQVVVPG